MTTTTPENTNSAENEADVRVSAKKAEIVLKLRELLALFEPNPMKDREGLRDTPDVVMVWPMTPTKAAIMPEMQALVDELREMVS